MFYAMTQLSMKNEINKFGDNDETVITFQLIITTTPS